MTHRKLPVRWAAVLVAALLAGCIGKEAPETRYYLLGAIVDGEPVAAARRNPPLVVELAALRLPQYLERPQLVTRVDANRLAIADYEKWGGNLAKNAARVLALNLATLLGTPEVNVGSARSGDRAAIRVEVEILAFERGADDRVRLDAQWRISDAGERTPALARIERLASAPVESGPAMDGTVAAMSALLGDLSRLIATAIATRNGS